jgi:hypothetical protein
MGDAVDAEAYRLAVALRDHLRGQLEADPTFRAYQLAESAVTALASSGGDRDVPPVVRAGKSRSPESQTARAVIATAEFLGQRGRRAETGVIFAELQRRGIAIGGARPTSTLASYLSNAKEFDNVKGEGYGLTEWSLGPLNDQHATTRQQPTSNATIWTNAAAGYLRAKGSRAGSAEICDALIKDGVMPDDQVSRHNLGAYLSRYKDRFDNVKGEGYGLCEWSRTSSNTKTPNSGTLFGAPRGNGSSPLRP